MVITLKDYICIYYYYYYYCIIMMMVYSCAHLYGIEHVIYANIMVRFWDHRHC